MIIDCGVVILRAIEEKDQAYLLDMLNDPAIERMTGGAAFPISLDRQLRWFQCYDQQKELRLMIEIKGGQTIGCIMLTQIDWRNRTAELSEKTKARPEDRVQGDVLAAMMGLLHYAFLEMGMKCIYGTVLEYNVLSRKLAARCGLKEEGVLRKRVYKNGKHYNLIANSVIDEDFAPIYKEYKEGMRNVNH